MHANYPICKEQYCALQSSLALIDDVTRLRTPAEIVILIGRHNAEAARRAILAHLVTALEISFRMADYVVLFCPTPEVRCLTSIKYRIRMHHLQFYR